MNESELIETLIEDLRQHECESVDEYEQLAKEAKPAGPTTTIDWTND